MHRYPWKHALVLTAVQLFVPALLCVRRRPKRRASCSYSPSHMVSPHFITPPSLVAGRANSTRWRGRALELQKLSGLEHEFPLSLSLSWLPPRPHPDSPLRIFASNLRSVSVNTQGGLCSADMVAAVTGPSPGTRPLLNCPLKPPRPGSPDTEHDPVMSYQSVCVCIIQAKRVLVCHHAV